MTEQEYKIEDAKNMYNSFKVELERLTALDKTSDYFHNMIVSSQINSLKSSVSGMKLILDILGVEVE